MLLASYNVQSSLAVHPLQIAFHFLNENTRTFAVLSTSPQFQGKFGTVCFNQVINLSLFSFSFSFHLQAIGCPLNPLIKSIFYHNAWMYQDKMARNFWEEHGILGLASYHASSVEVAFFGQGYFDACRRNQANDGY